MIENAKGISLSQKLMNQNYMVQLMMNQQQKMASEKLFINNSKPNQPAQN